MTDGRPEESDGDGEIPLDITGHEDREAPGASNDGPASEATGEPERPDGGTEVFTGSGTGTDGTESAPTPGVDGDSDAGDDTGPEDDADEASVEPVEVLVGLAEDGEIDPWDIDVVRVTDKFLERLDEGDLRTSGRALFYASVLLRMKSDAMLEDDDDDEEPWDEPWEAEMAGEAPTDEPDPFAALEQEMDRRLERKRARGMPQTLDELVRDLREAERDNWWKESREYDTSDSPEGFQRGTQELDYRRGDDLRMDDEPTAADVTERVHDENMDEIIDEVHAAVREHYEKGREEVLYREVETAGGSRVETFLGLLFLAHRGRVRLQQDELFGDLWIQDPSAPLGSEEAVAD